MGKSKAPNTGSGGVTTNYGYFIQDGIYITFITDDGTKTGTTGTVISPELLKGRKCQKTASGWRLV